ncbi:MAG: hypothetical protein PHU85_07955 [Phycisphaerae bacterium]|nr:hypothetical protein [Phycisphaerae bacterium]
MTTSRRHGGYALVLVIGLVAAVSVLGLSYIEDNSLTVQGSNNLCNLSRARYVAESGVEQAIFWLGETNPPNANADGYWPGATRQLVDTSGNDCCDVSVARDENDATRFCVTSVGYVMKNATEPLLSHRVTVWVTRSLDPTVTLNYALLVEGTSSLSGNQTYNGPVHSNGSIINNGTIAGNMTACGWALYGGGHRPTGTVAGYQAAVSFPDFEYNNFTSYKLNNATCAAAVYTSPNMQAGYVVPNADTTNPGRVVYAGSTRGYVTLKSNLALQGTLVVQGDVYLNGTNITITPQPGFPAIVASGHIYFQGASNTATLNGAVLLQAEIGFTGSTWGNRLTVNGPMHLRQALSIASWSNGGITVNFTNNTARSWLYNVTIPPEEWPSGRVDVQSWSDR